jgi:N-acetyl-anhydromuramyl-L-alanine amidase AmpD
MNWIKRFFANLFNRNEKPPTPQVDVPSLPPESEIDWEEVEGIEFQRLPELPMSSGRKAKIEALVIHYTNGWQNQRAFDAISFMQKMKHGYLFIDKWGSCWQHIYLDQVYAHAGISVMPSFSKLAGRNNVSSFSIGIEVANGGRLNAQNKTSFGKKVEPDQVRTADIATHGKPGKFEKFLPEQEKALIETCVRLCRLHKLDPSNVVAHHEISPDRRDDVAGALSMGMHGLRAILAQELARV